MTFADWLRETSTRFRKEPFGRAASDSVYDLYVGGLRRVGKRMNYGTPIWEHDWDVLLILDACRADLFRECYGNDDRFDDVDSVTSLASHSIEFMEKTFDERWAEEQSRTAYICGNPFSGSNVEPGRLAHLDEVWRYGWDENLGTIPPDPLSDAAITHYRGNDPDRMIVHYMQPHIPFVVGDHDFGTGIEDADEWGDWGGGNEFDHLRRGEVSEQQLWSLFRKNLEYVVEQIADTLLVSIDADQVVFSADHGNAFGEWGIYGHPRDVPLGVLKRVPWATTSAQNTGEYEPTPPRPAEEDRDREAMLRDLGYR